MDAELLKILCCPETHQKLQPAALELVEQINGQIAAERLKNRAGDIVREKMDGGLVREDKRFMYAVRQNLPMLLIDEAIPLN